MRILIATVGSRGDVQPYVALAQGLQAAGHRVWIVTDATFETFIRQAGVGFKPAQADPQKPLQEDIRRIGANPLRLFSWINRHFQPLARQYFQDVLEAAQGMDGLIFSGLAFAAAHVAESLEIPSLAAYLQPVTPTRAFTDPTAVPLPARTPFWGALTHFSARLSHFFFLATLKGTVDVCRREILGLPPVSWGFYWSLDTSEIPILYGFSRHVVPRPPDWGPWLHLTGYWFLARQADWQPPAELLAFLEAGPPPVYLGFGSMVDRERRALADVVVAATAQTGQRAVLLGGWGELGADGGLPDRILRVDRVPHDWLFPRMAGIVHHGGAGTTAAALRAGVPAAVVPYFADQPFWARRVHRLGLGPAPIPRLELTVDRLAQAITTITSDPEMRRKAAELGQKIRSEDGVAAAVPLIERYLSQPFRRLT